jgi:hypothetical protein
MPFERCFCILQRLDGSLTKKKRSPAKSAMGNACFFGEGKSRPMANNFDRFHGFARASFKLLDRPFAAPDPGTVSAKENGYENPSTKSATENRPGQARLDLPLADRRAGATTDHLLPAARLYVSSHNTRVAERPGQLALTLGFDHASVTGDDAIEVPRHQLCDGLAESRLVLDAPAEDPAHPRIAP